MQQRVNFSSSSNVCIKFFIGLKNNANNTTNYVHWLVTMLSTRDLEKYPLIDTQHFIYSTC